PVLTVACGAARYDPRTTHNRLDGRCNCPGRACRRSTAEGVVPCPVPRESLCPMLKQMDASSSRLRRALHGLDGRSPSVAHAPPAPIGAVFRRFSPSTRLYRRWIPCILLLVVLAPALFCGAGIETIAQLEAVLAAHYPEPIQKTWLGPAIDANTGPCVAIAL